MQDYIALDSIQSLPGNPKDHDIGQIANSLARFGFAGSIVVNKRTDHMLAGHGRVEALRWMKVRGKGKPRGIDSRPVRGSAMWFVPVDYVDISEEEEPALAIALNRLVEQGGWDEGALLKQLDDLVIRGKEMLEGIGFDPDDIDQIRTRLNFDDMQTETAEEQVTELQAGEEEQKALIEQARQAYNVEKGDLWGVGPHRLYCGDAGHASTWQIITDASKVQGIFTSPPYAQQREEYYESVAPDDYVKWWDPIQTNMSAFLADGSSYFLNIKPNVEEGERLLYVMDLILAHKRQWGWAFIDQFCWERPAPSGQWPNRFKNAWDSIYHFAHSPKINFYPDNVAAPTSGVSKGASNVNTGKYFNMHHGVEWTTARPSNRLPTFGSVEGHGHPAAFPPGLPAFFMVAFSSPGDTWIDPFCGSGSTLIAAADTNRIGLGIDISPDYIALSLQRLEQITGTKAYRINNNG